MPVRQIAWPNLDNDSKHPLYVWVGGKILSDWCGWCLGVVSAAWGATWSKGHADCAKNAWYGYGSKHADYELPDGIFVPIFWVGAPYGHVAIAKRSGSNVEIWTSPYTHKPYYEYFRGELHATINNITRIYGCAPYAGWSEQIGDKRVMEYYEEQKPAKKPESKPAEPVKEPESKPAEPAKKPESKPVEPVKEPEKTVNGDGSNVPAINMEEYMKIVENNIKLSEASLSSIADAAEQTADFFKPSDKVKLVAYIIGDAFIVAGMMTPLICNIITAPTIETFCTALATALSEFGAAVLLIFKLVKKKS